MDKNTLHKILVAASAPSVGINFSDAQSAAKNALIEYFGISGEITARGLRNHKTEIFSIIEEVLDEVVPQRVVDRTSDFAETKVIARNDKAVFTIKTTEASKQRMRKSIQPGSRGGIYKAYRLDGNIVEVKTSVEAVAYMITLEELLTGQRTIAELIEQITNSWVEKIYIRVFKMLQTAAADAPSVNKVGASSSTTIENAQLDKVISIVKAYGRPIILGFSQHLSLLGNTYISGNSTRPSEDLSDIRNKGYIGTYKGTPVIELPNYIASHNADGISWVFNENRILILPADEKPVKLVFQGESFTSEVAQPHGGMEWHNHRMFGMTVLFNNYIGSYELKDAWTE